MTAILRLAAVLALSLCLAALPDAPAQAQQGCYHNGVLVPHGTRIGGSVCRDGVWRDG